jgi:hypothetical protein
MAISNMQQAQQLRANGGIMTIPRQNYGLGKLVKKAVRGIKKVAKSPIGKAALLYAGGTMLGGSEALGGAGGSFMSRLKNPKNLGYLKNILGTDKLPGLKGVGGEGIGRFFNPFNRANPLLFTDDKFSGNKALIAGGALATALPFMLGGEDEEEEIVESFSETPSSIKDIVTMARARDPSLRFLPQNAYTQAGFFNAAGGGLASIPRAGYQMGGPTDDVMVENIDTQEVVSNPDPMAELNMLAIELFGKSLDQLNETEKEQLQNLIQSRMQQQDQQRVMAESGGMMDYMSSANPMAESYLMEDEDIVNMYRPGGERRQMAAEGGIMDLGGMEKDYRNEGGFVPIGAKERADDVPARLSKNEFVFTADAVRNAGGGDIDRGAEVMENLMNNLEQGGEVSEESQGMNPAQEMFDTAQMLESRIA